VFEVNGFWRTIIFPHDCRSKETVLCAAPKAVETIGASALPPPLLAAAACSPRKSGDYPYWCEQFDD
jgi:hypothetical protein